MKGRSLTHLDGVTEMAEKQPNILAAVKDKAKAGISRIDLLGLVKSLVREFVLPTALKSVIYAAVAGIIFFIAGITVYNLGISGLLGEASAFFGIVAALVITALYTFVGVLVGLTIGATSSTRKKLAEAEGRLHPVIEPLMAGIIAKMPVGQEGIPIAQFNELLRGSIASVAEAPEQKGSTFFSIAGAAYRLVLRKILSISQTVLELLRF